MAETLTFENTQEATSVENLNADEQDSLKVGEAMQEAEDSLLAGKYKDAQELEKAYVELQKKLGDQSAGDSSQAGDSEDSEQVESKEDSEETKETEENTQEYGILDDLWDQATSESGEYSKETLDKLGKLSTNELAKLHLEWRKDAATKYVPKPPDFTEQNVQELKNIAGGEAKYNDMMKWAQGSLSEQEISMFDEVMESGNPLSAFFAVKALAYRYNDEQGYQGKMLTGNAPKSDGSKFRSQAEVVQAMSDPRYERDAAYRLDIMEKLERSNINF
jgi:hypothetical protein